MTIPPGLFTPFNRVKPSRHGTMVYNIHDPKSGRSFEQYGEYMEGEAEVFRQILMPGMVAVEVGAGIGALTVFLAQVVYPGGYVMAFEPQRLLFQTLCANLAINSLANVDARQAALGASPGDVTVPFPAWNQDNKYGGNELAGHLGERVPLLTLDSFNLPQVDLLKVKVAGMEKAVLDGAAALIARCKPLLYVENHRDPGAAALIRMIDSWGYKLFWHLPLLYNSNNFAGNGQNVFGEAVSYNMLCLPAAPNYNLEGFRPVEVPPE